MTCPVLTFAVTLHPDLARPLADTHISGLRQLPENSQGQPPRQPMQIRVHGISRSRGCACVTSCKIAIYRPIIARTQMQQTQIELTSDSRPHTLGHFLKMPNLAGNQARAEISRANLTPASSSLHQQHVIRRFLLTARRSIWYK